LERGPEYLRSDKNSKSSVGEAPLRETRPSTFRSSPDTNGKNQKKEGMGERRGGDKKTSALAKLNPKENGERRWGKIKKS